VAELALTEEQVPVVTEILDEAEAERQALFSNSDDPPSRDTMGAVRVKIGEHRARTEERLAEILTDDQMKAYRTSLAERRQHMRPGGKRGGGRGSGRGF